MSIKRKAVKFIIICVVLFLGLILFKSAYHQKISEIKEVQTVPVMRKEINASVFGAGKIVSLDFYKVSEGIIPIPVNNPEKEKNILCTLSNPEEKKLIQSSCQNLQLAASEVKIVKARLKEAERRYSRNLKNASLNLKTTREQYEKTEKLYQAGAVSKQQLIEAENAFKRAELQYEETSEKVDIYSSKIQLEKAQIQFKNNYQEMKNLFYKLKEKDIPDAGRWNRVIEIKIDEFDIKKIKIGQMVKIKGNSFSQELSGYILKIDTELIQDQSYPYIRVISSIENTPGIELTHGLQIEAEIKVAQARDVIVVPLSAVLERENEKGIYVIEKGRAILKSVKIGLCGEEMVEVKKGLKEGDMVITLGNLELQDGDKVKVKK